MTSKAELLAALRAHLDAELARLTESQREAQAGAVHEEARAEGDKDMRATETSYLARGLAERVLALRRDVALAARLSLAAFDDDTPLALGALVTVRDGDGVVQRLLLAPVGAGVTLGAGDDAVLVVTPKSPLGQALLGKRVGDDALLVTPGGRRELEIVAAA